ncbi:helix-turn-helix transcriptional regulator [Actinocorallia herbida]|uniref:helix-turn-helix transcriptional regulator n=1 Tax=Actinocorallia herbida TaxID=58109 RepID=UPI0011CDD082|nr:LuxR family transcriptional regulator [Actinocorallia herbida]
MLKPEVLFGREREIAAIELLTAGVGERGAALIVRGEAGCGKTALLDHAERHAESRGLRVLRAAGVESEAEIDYAALHQLLYPVLDRIGDLHASQRDTLARVLGMTVGGGVPGDRFVLALAVLGLLSEASPAVVIVDDAHWLDHASADALRFAARRLAGEQICLLFGVRDGHEHAFGGSGLAELPVGPLAAEDAALLLTRRVPHPIAAPVREQLLTEAAGNPLALLELPAGLTPDQLSGTVPLPERPYWATRLTTVFVDRVQGLPPSTRTLLLLAAADDALQMADLLKAGELLGIAAADLDPAERKGVVHVRGDYLAFRHPLVRSAVYQSATFAERQAVHLCLARVRAADPDRAAWHRAAAVGGRDAEVSDALEAVADRAQQRSGAAAAAAALARSAELSPDPAVAAARQARAAEAARLAGRPSWARTLASTAGPHTADETTRAQLAYTLASIQSETGEVAGAGVTLSQAELGLSDPRARAQVLSRAMWFAWNAGDLPLLRDIAERLRALPVPPLQRAVAVLAEEEPRPAAEWRPLSHGEPVYLHYAADSAEWYSGARDRPSAEGYATRLEAELRERGAFGELALALEVIAQWEADSGHPRSAQATAEQGLLLTEETGWHLRAAIFRSLLALSAARSGDAARTSEMASAALDWAAPHQVRSVASRAVWALGLLHLAGADPAAAHRHLIRLVSPHDVAAHFRISRRALADVVEAAVRADARADLPADLPLRDDPLSLRARALLEPGDAAFGAALAAAEGFGDPYELARTRLLYGEWLRRERRPREARGPLRAALNGFETLGAAPWADRARTVLRATGDSVAPNERGASAERLLTPQELQIARFAAQGMSNREIGAQLFLSPRTVGSHLYRIFPKLGITARAELRTLIPIR